jgi:hypothetical protein
MPGWESALAWFVVALLGGALGTAELMSRYRDSPIKAIGTWPAILYILINIGASAGAYALAQVFGWSFPLGNAKTPASNEWSLVLICGLSAMALFRSSLFVRRVGDRDVGVGPISFLQVFLNAADAEVDRGRAVDRAAKVTAVMKNVRYEKAQKVLPPFCLALMQNLSDDVQRDLARSLQLLDGNSMPSDQKTRLLGLELVNVVGLAVLEHAVSSLGDQITD